MPNRAVYELLYRLGAARSKRGWDLGVGPEIVALVDGGVLSPSALGGTRAIDLGCGSGDNVIFLASRGFDAVGVDFSPAAVRQASDKARVSGIARARFLVGDITQAVEGVDGTFDLVVLYNVLQDLRGDARRRLAHRATRLTRPGSRILVWCWYGRRRDLPWVSYRGPSRIAPFVIEPGEERTLFGDGFTYERPEPQPDRGKALFLLTRR